VRSQALPKLLELIFFPIMRNGALPIRSRGCREDDVSFFADLLVLRVGAVVWDLVFGVGSVGYLRFDLD
jgi:hypothetical protein